MNNIVPFTLHCFTMDLSQNGFVTLFVEFRGFFVPPCPPLRPCCQLVGHSLPWHARVSMNIASEHVNKKHQKTKHLRLFLLKRHHCMIRFNLMQGTTKSGNLSPATYGSVSLSHRFCWRSSSLIHFAPCVRTAPYGPITKSIKKLQYFLHKQGSHRTRVLEGISCVYITIYQLTFMSQKPSGSGTPSPSSHQIVGACHMLYLGTMRRVCLEIGTPYLRQFSWNTMIKPWIFRGTSTTNPEWYENTCTIIYNLCVCENDPIWSNSPTCSCFIIVPWFWMIHPTFFFALVFRIFGIFFPIQWRPAYRSRPWGRKRETRVRFICKISDMKRFRARWSRYMTGNHW
jgi:hypothetical protein